MGKGNRNSQQRVENRMANEEKLIAKQKAKQNKKRSDRIVAISLIVFALIVAAVITLNVLSETGVFLRTTDAMTLGDQVVDSAMMTFFINDHITNWYNQYYVYVMYGLIKLDMSADLRTQKIDATAASYLGDSTLNGTTWYDYFVNGVIANVEMYITYANQKEAVLTAEDEKEIDETITELREALKANKLTFAQQYGTGVTEADVRRCYELIYRAANYAEYIQAYYEDVVENEDGKASIVAYPEDNKEMFYSAEYLAYSISVSEKKLGTQKAYDDAVKDAKAAAMKISEAKTPADFAILVNEYEDSLKTNETSTSTETKTEAETKAEGSTDIDKETIYYETSDELGEWLFAETNAPAVNDVKVVEETSTEKVTTAKTTEQATEDPNKETDADGKIVYENFKVTVYMVTKLPDLDRSKTQNIAYMISDNKEAAEAFLAAFLGSETKNRDVFEELAKAQYDKLFEGHDHENHKEGETDPVFEYAKSDQAKEKFFNDDYDALNKWLDDESRADNDYTKELIKVSVTGSDKKVTTYYVALYFEGHDDPAWYVDAFAGATQKKIDDWYKGEIDKKLIKYNMDAIGDISIIRYSSAQ